MEGDLQKQIADSNQVSTEDSVLVAKDKGNPKDGLAQEADSSDALTNKKDGIVVLDDDDEEAESGGVVVGGEEKQPIVNNDIEDDNKAISISSENEEAPPKDADDAADVADAENESGPHKDSDGTIGNNVADDEMAVPDSTSAKSKPRAKKKSLVMEEAHELIGSRSLGRTRSSNRKRSLKRASASPIANSPRTSRRSSGGTPASKRKRN